MDADLVQQAQRTVELLKHSRQTVVTAESCTGGLIAALLTRAPGASECVHGGFVTYTKANKVTALGVAQSVLEEKGSVNAQVATELASGALERSPADIALAVTGVLGPGPDEDGNPPGRVFFAVAARRRAPVVVHEHFKQGDPDKVRHAVTERALELLREAAQASRS